MNPPLAFFQRSGDDGPYTIPADQAEREIGSSVGIVSLPSTYRNSPIVWSALAHETGGHDVIHADDGLIEELGNLVQALFDPTPVTVGGNASQAQILGLLWNHWIDEAAADIYGILNIGPSFVPNLAAFFAALGSRARNPGPFPSLSVESGPNPDRNNEIDEHPTDIVRLHLAIGAIQSLKGLSSATISGYVKDIENIANLCAHGAKAITLSGLLPVDNDHAIPLQQVQIPLGVMQDSARKVGAAIVSTKLNAFQGHGIQEIETWDDSDETVAQQISTAYQAGKSVAGIGDDAQLLAGATLAVLTDVASYDQVTALLNGGLDDSFAKDPIFGGLRTDTAFMPGRFVHRASPAKTSKKKSKPPKK
jgi:hypothetical protein